ncbi:MAG: GAF domain-containing protein, partial [Bacteroidota bacterium]
QKLFREYKSLFSQQVILVKKKGFKDDGLVGKMRNKIHFVEQHINQKEDYLLSHLMLTLRRNEKDYLLRKDLKYLDKFDKNHHLFITTLKEEPYKNTAIASRLNKPLQDYKILFHSIIEKDKQLGTKNIKGVSDQMININHKIKNQIATINEKIYKGAQAGINQAVTNLYIALIFLSLGILMLLSGVSNYIIKSIKHFQKHIFELGKGHLPDKIKKKNNDEFGDMIEAINLLTINLKKTRDFAIEVGNGNLETDINVFNNEGELGGNLVEMRNRLLNVALERKRQEEEAEQRNWINEGVAGISDIIRYNNENIDQLAYELIRYLVKYSGFAQGGIFLIQDENQEQPEFKLMAAYAYDRKKYLNKSFALGDGLIGTCAIEKEPIYLTDIPDNYINITSGLGDANPSALLLVPLKTEEITLGVLEFASFEDMDQYKIDFILKVAESVSSSIATTKMNQKTTVLLEQSRYQAEELKAQEEELRQNMEELEATQENNEEKERELNKILKETREKSQQEIDYLNEHNKNLKDLIESISQSIMVGEIKLDGTFIYLNKQLKQFAGVEDSDTEKFSIFQLFPREQQAFITKKWKKICQGENHEEICEMIGANQHENFMKTSYVAVNQEGQPGKIIFTAKNLLDWIHIEASFPEQKGQMEALFQNLQKDLKNMTEVQHEVNRKKFDISNS